MIFQEEPTVSNRFYLFLSGLSDLPYDYRALLNTPRSVNIESIGGGHFWYSGIEKNLKTVFSDLNRNMTIALMFNVDGCPYSIVQKDLSGRF